MALARPDSLSLSQILEVLSFQGGYNTNAVIIGSAFFGLAAGVVGVLALLRKRSLVADAIGHATLPGIVIAFLAAAALGGSGRSLPVLLLGAGVSGALSVLCIFAILRFTRLREDAAIGIVLGVFFGLGVVLLSYVQRPENVAASPAGLHHFIYGQTAAMRAGDGALMGGIALVAMIAVVAFFKEFALASFNGEYARVVGYPVGILDGLMLGLVVLVSVAGLQAVGLILVIALLIIPPVAARLWTDRLPMLVLIAGGLGALSGYVGAATSALLPRAPAGSVIVLCGGGVFVLSLLAAPRHGVVAVGGRRILQRLRIAAEHWLEAAYEHRVSRRGVSTVPLRTVRAMEKLWGWPVWQGPLVITSLRRRGYINRVEGGYELSPAGVERGARIARNHKLWEQYLHTYADVAPGHVDWSADTVEHVLSPELVAELEAAIGRAEGGRT
ncbi:MAG: metal ABC transporter permease [Phycisphaerales bacterium JB060]